MGQNAGGWLPSAQGQNNFINTIMAIARLREAQATGESLREFRATERLKQEAETIKLRDQMEKTKMDRLAGGIFGQPADTPEVNQSLFTSGATAMSRPGAMATNILPLQSEVQRSREPFQVAKIDPQLNPSVASRPADTGDVARVAITGPGGRRDLVQDSLARMRAYGVPTDDALYQNVAEGRQLILPSQTAKLLEDRAKAQQAAIKTRSDTYDLANKIAVSPTVGLRAKADLAAAQADARIKNVTAEYAPYMARMAADEKEVGNERTRLLNQDTRLTIKKNTAIDIYAEQYARTNDPAEQKLIAGKIAAASGQVGGLIPDLRETQQAVVQAEREAAQAQMTALKLALDPNNPDPAGATRYLDTSARQRLASAKLTGATHMRFPVGTVVPSGIAGYGAGKMVVSEITAETPLVEMHLNGRLGNFASGQETTNDPRFDQGKALAWHIRFKYGGLGADLDAYNRAITEFPGVSPEVKQKALASIGDILKMSPSHALHGAAHEDTGKPLSKFGAYKKGFGENVTDVTEMTKKDIDTIGQSLESGWQKIQAPTREAPATLPGQVPQREPYKKIKPVTVPGMEEKKGGH